MRLPETSSGVRLDPHPVPLEPFGHQVAGQASMLMLDPSTVCKPLIPREHQLYCTLPASLRPFTPRCCGVLYVRLEEGEDGSLNLWGYYPVTEDKDHRVDNGQVIRPPPDREDAGNKERNRENRNVSKGPSPRKEVEKGDRTMDNSSDIPRDTEHMADSDQNKGQTSKPSPLQEPPRPTDNGKVPKCPAHHHHHHHNAEHSVDVKASLLPSKHHVQSSPLPRCGDDDLTQDVDEADRRGHQRQGVGEVGGLLQPLPSGFSSGASTPMSSGSEQDLPSAVDHGALPSQPSARTVVRLTEDGEYEVTGGRVADNKFLITTDDQALSQTSSDPNPGSEVTTQPLNPWGLSLHTRLLDKMRKSQPSPSGCPFLVLENVVARFARPCILDLKVGSRLHDDDASPKKMASQSRKCNMTTSRSLGLRLCGMQVYQETTGAYKSLDKYHGRTLTDETFYEVLRDFLHNGRELRGDLLSPILARLRALMDNLNELHSFRFYASSLLIMYDGQSSPSPHPPAEVPVPETVVGNKDKDREGKVMHVPSSACEQGRSLRQDVSEQGGGISSGSGRENNDTSACPAPSTGQHSRQTGGAVQPSAACASKSSGFSKEDDASYDRAPDSRGALTNSPSAVDVRMIDFAHTTHSGFHDNMVHEGPDKDYIWGLQNLTRMFTQLHKEYS